MKETTTMKTKNREGEMTEAKKNGWIAISLKNDWKRVFPFEKP